MTSIRISGSDEVIEVIERGPQSPSLPGYDPVTRTLTANIAVRTGTLNTLLNLTDAADGEISVASDADVIVKHSGSPSVPRVYGSSGIIAKLRLSTLLSAGNIIPTDVVTQVNLQTTDDLLGLFDEATSIFYIPSIPGVTTKWFKLSGMVRLGTTSLLGTYITIAIDQEVFPGFWLNAVRTTLAWPQELNENQSFMLYNSVLSPVGTGKHRVSIIHDAGVDETNLLVAGDIEFGI